MKYPSRNGIPIPIYELDLPPSNCEILNNHHNCWTARKFGQSILFLAVRNLETHQFLMPVDQHAYLHSVYDPPELPTPQQAINELERALDAAESLKTRHSTHLLTKEILDRCTKAI